MKYMKWGKFVFRINIVFYMVYNSYFGWNIQPQTDFERLFDIIFQFGNIWAIYLYIYPLLVYYELYLDRLFKEHKKTK